MLCFFIMIRRAPISTRTYPLLPYTQRVRSIGKRVFSACCDAECQAPSPVREMRRIDVVRVREFIAMDVVGNAFLHHMVRNIVGTLIEVGQGRRPAQWVAEVLDGRDRRQAGITAPADGLYFVGPPYPAE